MNVARRTVGLLLALVCLLAACGIESDSEPRDITGDRQQQLSEVGRGNNDIPAGGNRIFLLDAAAAQNAVVRAVARDVDAEPRALVQALLDGPTASERARRLRTAIPAGTELLDVAYIGPGLLAVDLSATLLEASGDTLVAALSQIVYTLSQLDSITEVQLRVNGQIRQWPTGDGTLTSAPLSVYLFPGRAASTQPDFPALPSGTAAA